MPQRVFLEPFIQCAAAAFAVAATAGRLCGSQLAALPWPISGPVLSDVSARKINSRLAGSLVKFPAYSLANHMIAKNSSLSGKNPIIHDENEGGDYMDVVKRGTSGNKLDEWSD